MKFVIYDIETLANAFLVIFYDVETTKVKSFIIHNDLDESEELYSFLGKLRHHEYTLVGFNNLKFDANVLNYMWLKKLRDAKTIYNYVQDNINKFRTSAKFIQNIDLYKIAHFDNKNKRTSLKWLQYSMNFPNIQEMPIHHSQEVSLEELQTVVYEYCLNDVMSTKAFFEYKNIMKEAIALRVKLSEEYELDLLNANDPEIGSEIFCKLLSDEMSIEPDSLKKLRTVRNEIKVQDVLLPYISFEDETLRLLLKSFKDLVVYPKNGALKNCFHYKIKFTDIQLDYGLGGIHGSQNKVVYDSNDEYVILDLDVASYYPNLAVANDFKPQHLGESFSKIYKYLFEERQKIPKSNPLNAAYKLALNGVYGKTGSEYSYLYDLQYMLTITINGQLLLTMLLEQLSKISKIIQANTDGVTIYVKRDLISEVNRISQWWMNLTGLVLEEARYSKMIIRDVNSYISIYENGKYKLKGFFEIERDLHKKQNFPIIAKALLHYYKDGIPIEQTIRNETNMYYFCSAIKRKDGNVYDETNPDEDERTAFTLDYYRVLNGQVVIEKQEKVVRYFISKKSGSLWKNYYAGKKKGSKSQVEAGENIGLAYKVEDIKDVNYAYYISKTREAIIGNKDQLTLC